MAKVELSHVSYSIQDGEGERDILRGIDYAFTENTITTISGPSGSGKTTLLYAVAGLLDTVRGEVLIDGNSLYQLKEKDRDTFRLHHLSFIFQNLNLFSFMDVKDNILMPFYVKKKRVGPSVLEKVEEVLRRLNLPQILGKPINALSGGEQQRVAIARALIDEVDILLCDEPTANLDGENTEVFIQSLREIEGDLGSTIIIASHDRRVVEGIGNNIRLESGLLVGD